MHNLEEGDREVFQMDGNQEREKGGILSEGKKLLLFPSLTFPSFY